VSDIPSDLKYTKSHEWVRQLPSNQVEVGITDHAQAALGDLVFVDVPELGRRLQSGEACAVVESVKAASDIYSPVEGTVVANNAALASTPELVNQAPYAGGWLVRIEVASGGAAPSLLERGAVHPVSGRRSAVARNEALGVRPFIPHTPDDVAEMLAVIGAQHIEDLFDEIPPALKSTALPQVPPALSEMEVGRLMSLSARLATAGR
jgi:glycine cleavage system H protein